MFYISISLFCIVHDYVENSVEDLYCSKYVQCRPYQCSFSRISQFRSLNRNWERAELDMEIRRNAQSARTVESVL